MHKPVGARRGLGFSVKIGADNPLKTVIFAENFEKSPPRTHLPFTPIGLRII